ncbi:hypothetical protein AYK24_07365 [Thermoplasmatales archaeon SG8-52-4]|nr:MAG: hypothetical protein AYK24_07365 [Thermoplasmatales archaeon SG8-52-4]
MVFISDIHILKLSAKFICIVFLFCNTRIIHGQVFTCERVTTQNGLSQNTINSIFQDSQGFLWLGTQDGLNRYNGYDFKIFRHQVEDTNSLSHGWIWDIIEDQSQNLWVATWNGLNKLSAVSNQFIRYYTDSLNTGYKGNRPTSFSIDTEGYLWIGTWGEGLNKYDHVHDLFTNYSVNENSQNSIPSNLIRDIYHDRRGRLWVGTWNGLSSIDSISTEGIVKISTYQHDPNDSVSLSDNRVTSIFEDNNGNLWIGTLEGGLNRLIHSNQSFKRYQNDPKNPHSISGNDISCIMQDHRGVLWVGTNSNGLNRYYYDLDHFETISYNPNESKSLAGNNVFSIYEDQSGLIWIGANALNKYNPFKERFNHLKHDPDNPNSLSHSDIGAIFQTIDEDLWIGTEGGGLNKCILDENKFERFLFQQYDPELAGNIYIGSITEDIYGNLWIGTRRNGIYLFDKDKQKFIAYNLTQSGPEYELMNYINFICSDREGHLWIATFNNGLFRLNIKDNSIKNFKNDPNNLNSLSGNYLLRLYLDDQNRLWIASWGGGLCAYHDLNKHFYRYQHEPNDSTTIADNIVYSIHSSIVDNKEILWVGTGTGLSYADLNEWPNLRFKTVTMNHGLPNNTIYSIQNDKKGNLWISTNYGICKYNPIEKTFHSYFEADGLQGNEFNGGAGFTTTDGYILFGGVNGLNIFHPDSIQSSTFSPNIIINSIYVFNEKYLEDRSIYASNKIELTYQQNFFSFEFSALDFAQPNKIQYAYMLEGIDKAWVYSQSRRLVNYTDIDPGEYVFKVKSTNSEQIWNENETSIIINIIPPFWKTWWFRSLGILLFLGLIYLGHRYRIRKLLEIERLRVRIASDLHDDFGSALTRIAIHSEQIQSSADKKGVHLLSKKIGEISREVISSMSDIVWSIDARNDTLRNLVDRMQEINVNILLIRDIEVNFKHKGLSKNKTIPVDYRQNIYYIYKEAINNIVKHSSANSVDILLDNTNHQFIMYIKDNGLGFDFDKIKEGNGLRNMQMRAKRINADISINSNGGTEICLKMKRL